MSHLNVGGKYKPNFFVFFLNLKPAPGVHLLGPSKAPFTLKKTKCKRIQEALKTEI